MTNSNTPITVPAGIFREYDIRGFVDSELSTDLAYALGRALALAAQERALKKLGVGFDCRHSSGPYARALARGITDGGVDCVLTGMGPTPQLYYAIHALSLDGGIQITGSHNPPDMNGFKITLDGQSLYGPAIQDLRHKIEQLHNIPAPEKRGLLLETPVLDRYITELVVRGKPGIGDRQLRVVVDAGNGVGGMVGPRVLKALGVSIRELYCEPDGNFPNHHPDPTVAEYIVDLQRSVVESKADFGIGWDGDADRIGVVDENGQLVYADLLLMLFARDILRDNPGETIIGDVKCSSRVFNDIAAHGGTPIMWKTGHSLIKAKLKETNAALAGEMSGHIAFNDRWYGFDDALYSTVRLIELMSNTDKTLSELLADLPTAFTTPEIRVDCPDDKKFLVPTLLAEQLSSAYELTTIDGVRVNFPQGWALVRASNTQAILVLRFEAETAELLEEYQQLIYSKLELVRQELEIENELVPSGAAH